MRRAQAAMEYLITYGWAILIMLVVVGVLFYLGIFGQQTIAACSFRTPGFSCFANKLVANTAQNESGLILDLAQASRGDIVVIGFNCTIMESWTLSDFDGTMRNVTIQSGSHRPLNGTPTSPGPLPCWKSDGTTISAKDVDSYYKGKIYVHYIDLETNLDHKAIGDISGRIE